MACLTLVKEKADIIISLSNLTFPHQVSKNYTI